MSIWDDPTIKPTSEYVKFDAPGDSVSGEILATGIHQFEDGKRAAKLVIRTDIGEVTLTAGQMQLAAKLAEVRPEPGDHITVTYLRSEKRAGGKTLKHFEVNVKRAATRGVKASDLI